MKLTYRKATKRDLDALYFLAVQFTEFNAKKSGKRSKFFFKGWKKSFRKEILEELSSFNSTYFLAIDQDLVAESKDEAKRSSKNPKSKVPAAVSKNGTAIGYILGKRCKDLYYYCIDELFVLPKYRKLKAGKKLLKMAVKKGKSFGTPVRVEIFNWNENAKKFYLENGFKEDSIVFEYSN